MTTPRYFAESVSEMGVPWMDLDLDLDKYSADVHMDKIAEVMTSKKISKLIKNHMTTKSNQKLKIITIEMDLLKAP